MTADYHTTAQVAARLGLHAGHVRKMAAKFGIGTRIGRDWLFTDADVRRLLDRKTTPGRARKDG